MATMMEEGLAHGIDHSKTDAGTFTCQACGVAFYTPDLQRTHYRSDWHRYNLKRRVANLTSVSATTFAEKVLVQKSQDAASADRANFAERCEPCGKVYYSENAYNNHIGSKKHRDAVKLAISKAETAADIEDDDSSTHDSTFSLEDSVEPSQSSIYESSTASPAPEAATESPSVQGTDAGATEEEQIRAKLENAVKLPLGECLFCRTAQAGTDEVDTLAQNVNHMVKAHSLFLPEQDYLVDLRGLIEYLQTKVSVGNFCLACNKGFRNIEACRAHMASVSHRRIAYSSEDEQMEISDFYDFSSTWADVDGADEGWEDSSDVRDDAEVVSQASDETVGTTPAAVADDFELRLPSGAVAGHRSLARYYRQNLRGRDPHAENGGSAVHKAIMDRTQAARQELVANSIAGVDAGRKKWSRKHVATFTDMRRREDFKTRVGFIANSQKHYRDPLLQ